MFTKNLFIVSILGFLGSVALVRANDESLSDDALTKARVVYPGHFTRPPSLGKRYDTWSGATGPDIGEMKVDLSRLPSRVDNSVRPEFPPVYRQKWGACGQFASVASIFTYEMNVLNGDVADSDATRFPAHFSWNMINRAQNKGSEAYHGWEVAKRIGIPTAKTYGGVRMNKIGVWPKGYEIWREAMEYRVSGYRYTPVNSIAQVNEARGWLFDRNNPKSSKGKPGGLMALDGRMGELEKVTVTIPKGSHEAGKKIWTRWGPSGYGHGITCVGYDDEVGHDLNGDGKITNDQDINDDGKVTLADWERGAFIVVNSWGKQWSDDGRVYLLYSAMMDPTWERGNFLGRVEVCRYVPSRTLKLKIACDNRSDLRVSIGVAGDENATAAEYKIHPEVLNGWPLFGNKSAGQVPLAGIDDPTPLEVGIDISSLMEKYKNGEEGRLFIKISRADGSKASGKLYGCAIRSYNPNGEFVVESMLEVKGGDFGKSQFILSAPLKMDKRL